MKMLCLWQLGDDFSIEEVIEAAKEVGVHDFIAQVEEEVINFK